MTLHPSRSVRPRRVAITLGFVLVAFAVLWWAAVPLNGATDMDVWGDPRVPFSPQATVRTQLDQTHRKNMLSDSVLTKDDSEKPMVDSSAIADSQGDMLANCPSTRQRERLARSKVDETIAYWRDMHVSAKRLDPTVEASVQRMLLGDVCGVVFEGNPGKVSATDLSRAASWHWLRASGAVGRTFDCPAVRRLRVSRALTATTQSLDWRRNVRSLPLLPLEVAPGAHSFPDPPTSTFVRAPKTASWVVASHVCATCESSGAFYMNPRHSCFFTLWGFGDETSPSLKKLVSASRKGRNAIFKEREGSFQFGEVLPSPVRWRTNSSSLSAASRAVPLHKNQRRQELLRNARFVSGTVVWNGVYEVGNVGHVIHDAVWAWQLTVMLRNLLRLTTSAKPKQQQHRGGATNTDNAADAEASRSSFPQPIRAVFAHDFSELSSDYFGVLSWLVAKYAEEIGEVGGVFRSPFESRRETFGPTPTQDEAVCFERLILPGQDRHADGGGLGLRRVVAQRLRRIAFLAAGVPLDGTLDDPSPGDVANRSPTIFVYGRNDVYRRSIDNTHQLWLVASRVARALGLPTPILIDTFQRPPLEQVKLMSMVDILLAIQGSHMQNSLFMPHDGAVIELAPCRANRVSFIQRYGKYLDSQEYTYISLCDGVVINYSDSDVASQNVTLCPQVLLTIETVLLKHAAQLAQRRKVPVKG